MNKQCVWQRKSALLLAAMLGASGLMAYERAALLPVDPYVMVRVSSVAACSNAVQSLPIGRLWKDEGFQNFLGHPDLLALIRSVSETNAATKEQLHLQDELWKLIKGEVILAIDQAPDKATGKTPDGTNFDLTYAAVTQFTAEDYRKMLAMEQQLADIDKQKIKRSHVDYQGQDIIQTVKLDDKGKETKSWQTFVNDVLLESDRKEWVEGAIARIKREGPPAAGKQETPSIEITVSGTKIRKSLEAAISKFDMPKSGSDGSGVQEDAAAPVGPANAKPKIDAVAVMKALGVDTLKTIKMTVKLEPAQTRIAMLVDRGSARQGIWAMVDTRPAPADVKLPFMPVDVVSFGVERANYPALWNEIPAVLRAIDPQMEMQFGMFQSMFGLNVAADVMAHLDTLFVSLQNNKDQMLMAVQLKNADGMAATLKRFLVAADPAAPAQRPSLGAKEEEFRGVSLYTWQTKPEQSMSVAVVGTMLYIGESELIRGIIRGQTAEKPGEDAFFKSAIYTEMLKNKPDGAMGYKLMNLRSIIRSLFSEANVAKMKLALAAKLSDPDADNKSPAMDKVLRGIDFSKMPAADQIAAFFGPVYGYATSAGDQLEYQWLIQAAK